MIGGAHKKPLWSAGSWDSLKDVSIMERGKESTREEGREERNDRGKEGSISHKMLRYSSVYCYADGYPVFNATYGQGTGPIVMDGMKCDGSEPTLQDCIFDPDASEDSHAEDAGVMCITGKPVAGITAHVICIMLYMCSDYY